MSLRQSFVQRLDSVPSPARRPVIIVWTIIQDLSRCDLLKQASAMAYVTLLSLVPSLVAVFCVLSLFSPLVAKGSTLVDDLRAFILNNLASGSGDTVVTYLDSMLAGLDLKSIGWSSFASVLVTLVLLLRQIEEALNRIWLVHKGRNIFMRFMYFWTFLTLGGVVLAVVVGVTAGVDVHNFLTLQEAAAEKNEWLGRFVGGGGAFLFFFFLYKVVPYCKVEARNAAIGAAVASLTLTVASWGYATYVIEAKSYKTLYGALAQVPLFLMWMYICWIIILVGALLTWRFQEGFPNEKDNETIDTAQSPVDQMRNIQMKAAMPIIALLAVYKNFQEGTGRGICAQDLAHSLHLPVGWVGSALDALQELGYVIASRPQEDDGASVTDPYFPALPAEQVKLSKLQADLARPLTEWMATWQYELSLDVPKALASIRSLEGDRTLTFAQAMQKIS